MDNQLIDGCNKSNNVNFWKACSRSSREKELETTLLDIRAQLEEIGFCCGYNDLIEGIKTKIEAVMVSKK